MFILRSSRAALCKEVFHRVLCTTVSGRRSCDADDLLFDLGTGACHLSRSVGVTDRFNPWIQAVNRERKSRTSLGNSSYVCSGGNAQISAKPILGSRNTAVGRRPVRSWLV